MSEFNAFVERNGATLVSTADVSRSSGAPQGSWPDRIRLARLLRRRRREFDLFIASGEDIGFPIALATIGLVRPPPVWIILHGPLLEGRKFRVLAPLLRRASHVHFLCMSAALRRRMIETFGFPAGRCHDAGYGVDTAFFAPEPAAPDTRLVVSAGTSQRDYGTLSQAVAGLDVAVRIAADSLWRPVAADAAPLALAPNVEVKSAGDYVGLRSLYADAAFVVVPLLQADHACGYAVIAEAMAMGKAVIATRTNAPSDLIVPGETGLYVAPGNVAGLREAIARLLSDHEFRDHLGRSAAARMRQAFSLAAYCERMETLCLAGAGAR